MIFYSGFSLKNDQILFKDYFKESEYTVAGFSYGAIKAIDYVLKCSTRVDTLQLFSPAFFQDRDKKYKRLQQISFTKSPEAYLKFFIKACFLPANIDKNVQLEQGTSEELEILLEHVYNVEIFKQLLDRGIKIEVYLGEEDKIINAKAAKDFFINFAEVHYVKGAGHTLNIKEHNAEN